MSRDIPSYIVDALNDDVVYPFYAVELKFDGDRVLRMWTGVGTLSFQGNNWVGTGLLLNIDTVEETTEIAAKGARITLSGVPSETVSLALGEPYQGRVCNIYFGMTGDKTKITNIFSGYMDQMNIEEGAETATIELLVENKLVDLERSRVARFSSSYQKSIYAGDKGLDFVEDLQNKDIVWGKKIER